MADNPTPQPPPKAIPLQQSSGLAGKLKSPTTQLPGKKAGPGKIVVMLSSVAKPPPAVTQSISMAAPPLKPPANAISKTPAQIVRQPPPMPPKQVAPAANPPSEIDRLSSTTIVKLPPKTTVPGWSLNPMKDAAEKNAPPLLPAKRSEPVTGPVKKAGAQHIPPIKLNESATAEGSPGDSILLQPGTPTAKVENSGPVNEKSQVQSEAPPLLRVPNPEVPEQKIGSTPAPVIFKTKPSPGPVVPPLLEKESLAEAKPILHVPPTALASAHPLQHAPPMKESETLPEAPAEKLPQPHLPFDIKKGEAETAETIHKAPALIPSETPTTAPTKALPPPNLPGPRSEAEGYPPAAALLPSPGTKPPVIAEARPALKPAILPKRALPLPGESKTEVPPLLPSSPTEDKILEKRAEDLPVIKSESTPANKNATTSSVRIDFARNLQKAGENKLEVAAASAVAAGLAAKSMAETPQPLGLPVVPGVPSADPKTAPPLTRVERSKKRRLVGTLIFWLVLAPITGLALIMGSFYFGRDTRVEGQVIPPAGMTVNTEVWVVSDFRELASGIAEDLAAERTPIMQEIQERREHVQRIQADIGSREERIRLIQDETQAAKDEIASLVKKSRDETQQIWDGEGAAIDGDYEAKLSQLKRAIADRAKSLNVKYEPDETYQSPEVWANAFRLALYQVPAGVDAVKEHQWLGDQMKQWRDFQKTLDDRKQQLREKAAQKKLEPAPKIADLNAKVDDLSQRIDATTAEEVPLKAELQQAQVDLATAQTADQGLDDKYYKQLYALPAENITYHIPVAPNGRFTWVEDETFAVGENQRKYWIFSRAIRSDGRQYWALGRISIEKNHKLCVMLNPESFVSTKAILRPNLAGEDDDQ